jgi:hypothetical protein
LFHSRFVFSAAVVFASVTPCVGQQLQRVAEAAESSLCAADGFIERSWQWDWEELQSEISLAEANPRAEDPRKDPYILDSQSLVWPTDHDPLDVELRRFGALLDYMRPHIDAPTFERTAQELAAITEGAAALDPRRAQDAEQRRALYRCVRAARRGMAFANPLLDFDEILFTTGKLLGAHVQTHFRATHGTMAGDIHRLTEFRSDRPQVESALRDARLAGGRHQGELLRDGALQTLDLSFDGRKLLFEWCARQLPENPGPNTIFNPAHFAIDNTFNICSLDLVSGDLQQLTDTRYNDAAPCWLPNGRIAFISDRREIHVRCHPDIPDGRGKKQRNLQPCACLFTMKDDGSDVVQLSWHDTTEVFPRLTNDGRIVYTRWDYIDREFHGGHAIWFCAPDGRDPRSPHGNYPLPHDCFDFSSPLADPANRRFADGRTLRPWAEYGIRPIPDSAKFVAVASVHHKSARGELVLIDPRIRDDNAMAQVRRITGRVLPSEGETRKQYRGGYPYTWPCPLSEDFYLVTHLPTRSLVLLDRFGNRDVLYQGSEPVLFAIPRRPRPRPAILAAQTYQGERADLPGRTPATISVMNVYESDFEWPQRAKVAALRIVQVFPRPWSSPFQKVGESFMSGTINRMALGTVPVEPDGSAYFEAPVECEIYFQALDEDGRALQSMRSGTYVHPGEQMSCVGCHEDKWKPSTSLQMPVALRRPPSKLEPEVGGLEPVNYYRLAKPILDAKCLGCHREENAPLTSSDYEALEPYAFYFHASGGARQAEHGGYRSGAGHVGARASLMGQVLYDERHRQYLAEGRFTEDDRRRITLWLDLNSLELGSSSLAPADQALQRAGGIVWPKLDFDLDNRQRVETNPWVVRQAGNFLTVEFHDLPNK